MFTWIAAHPVWSVLIVLVAIGGYALWDIIRDKLDDLALHSSHREKAEEGQRREEQERLTKLHRAHTSVLARFTNFAAKLPAEAAPLPTGSEIVTYELVFPKGLKQDAAAVLFQALGGALRQVGRRTTAENRAAMVFELFGTEPKLSHYLTFPAVFEGAINAALRGGLPDISFTPIELVLPTWTRGVELDMHDVITGKKGPPTDLIRVLLNGLRDLEHGEAMVSQLLLWPTGRRNEDEEDLAFQVLGRLAAAADTGQRAIQLLERALGTYGSMRAYSTQEIPRGQLSCVTDRLLPRARGADMDGAGLVLVGGVPLNTPEISGLNVGTSRKLPAPSVIPSAGIELAESNYGRQARPLAISIESLMRHAWVLGPTGSGKSTMLHHMAVQIMNEGHGLVLIEPKGDLAHKVLHSVPEHRQQDVIWFDPNDDKRPVGLNLLRGEHPDQVAGHLKDLLMQLVPGTGSRMERILKNALQTAASQGQTLCDVRRLLTERDFRMQTIRSLGDDDFDLRSFWREFEDFPDGSIDPVLNRLASILDSTKLRNIVGQTGGLDLAQVVDQQKILLVPLRRAKLGEAYADVLASVLVSELWSVIQRRSDQRRRPVIMMLDEFQNYLRLVTDLGSILAEARSHGLGAVLANQTVGQIEEAGRAILSAVRNNTRSKVAFAVEVDDAKKVKDFFPPLATDDLHFLGLFEVVLRLHTSSGMAPTTTGRSLPEPEESGFGDEALAFSWQTYGRDVAEVVASLRGEPVAARPVNRPKFGPRPAAQTAVDDELDEPRTAGT